MVNVNANKMVGEFQEKDIYVLLDFQGKCPTRLLKQQSVYFKMLNLNEATPIVEIGEDVYEGTYDDIVGTNVFFEEVEDNPQTTNVFERMTPITLKYLLKQTKILKLKKVGIKSRPVVTTHPIETVNLKINDDYRVILEKFANGTFNIDDYVTHGSNDEADDSTDKSDNEEKSKEQWESSGKDSQTNTSNDWYASSNNVQSDFPERNSKIKQRNRLQTSNMAKYAKLQALAEQPVQHKSEYEVADSNKYEQVFHFVHKSNFIIWKKLMMQIVEQQPINLNVNKDKIEDFVNIEKSVEAGIIFHSDANPRLFTKDEKQQLLSFRNFANVSPLLKLVMLQDYVNLEETAIEQMNNEQLEEVGEDGFTAAERLELIKSFRDELKFYIISRLQDEDVNNAELDETIPNLLDEQSDADSNFSSENECEFEDYDESDEGKSKQTTDDEDDYETPH